MSDLNPYEEGLAVDLARAQDRIEELEAENARLREAQGWQPIETAPNWCDILIAKDDGSVVLIEASNNDYNFVPYEKKIWCVSPTHWMSLPEAPKETDK